MVKSNFSPSVNIDRDIKKNVNYIPTANSKHIFAQIGNFFKSGGTRSFSIVGSYGTGKSAFLLAFEKTLVSKDGKEFFTGKKNYFSSIKNFQFLKIIGDYNSFSDVFAKKVHHKGESIPENIIESFKKNYSALFSGDNALIIIADEFGKFIEYATNHHPEKEMYFIQLLAEYANDTEKNIIFISTLHQNISAYSDSLGTVQRQEWNKVRGRLKELTFDEPVEQLLNLASTHLKNKVKDTPKSLSEVFKIIEQTKLFPLKTDIHVELAENLFPLDLLASAVLTLSLQKYGQNERSLFSFLETSDYLGINDVSVFKESEYYNIASVYDYLLNNFYSFLFTKYNPHYAQWAALRTAIERVESVLSESYIVGAIKIVKVIGLLNIFASESARLEKEFLIKYSDKVLHINNADKIIDILKNQKIIRFAEYKHKFILFEGTDLDIEQALHIASERVQKPTDIIAKITEYFEFPYVLAKRAFFENGTPRYFEYKYTDVPIHGPSRKEIDGVINLIISENIPVGSVEEYSLNNDNAVLYGFYTNYVIIRDTLWEIEKIKYVIKEVHDDKVAQRELQNLLKYQIQILNKEVHKSFYNNEKIIWFYKGEACTLCSQKDLSKKLSDIVFDVYNKTPIFKNELANREKLPGSITVARRNFYKALIQNIDKAEFGMSEGFPPERMIYKSILSNTGIHCIKKGIAEFNPPNEESGFGEVWNISHSFLNSARLKKHSLNEFYEILEEKPFRLRRGFLEFWIPLFLYINKDQFSLFYEDRYITSIDDEMLELCIKAPKKIEIKTFNVTGVKLDLYEKYRKFIKQDDYAVNQKNFIEMIKPFIVFYKMLPDYSKYTGNLSPHAKKIRDAILKSKDPETTFFEDFPVAIGYNNIDLSKNEKVLKGFIEKLQNSIDEIKNSYDVLIERIISSIVKVFGYKSVSHESFVNRIAKRYDVLQNQVLTNHQKALLTRLINNQSDRVAWVSSIVSVLMNKSLEKVSDDDVKVLINRINDSIQELDDLCQISDNSDSDNSENVVLVSLLRPGQEIKKQIIRFPENYYDEISELYKKVSSELSKSKTVNCAVIAKLLEDNFRK